MTTTELTTVTKAEFWAAIMATKINVHPRIAGNYRDGNGISSIFETQDWQRRVVARIDREYVHGVEPIYRLVKAEG